MIKALYLCSGGQSYNLQGIQMPFWSYEQRPLVIIWFDRNDRNLSDGDKFLKMIIKRTWFEHCIVENQILVYLLRDIALNSLKINIWFVDYNSFSRRLRSYDNSTVLNKHDMNWDNVIDILCWHSWLSHSNWN